MIKFWINIKYLTKVVWHHCDITQRHAIVIDSYLGFAGLSYLLHVTKGERFNATAVWDLVQTHVPSAVLLPAPRGQGHVTFKLPLGVPAQTSALLMALTE